MIMHDLESPITSFRTTPKEKDFHFEPVITDSKRGVVREWIIILFSAFLIALFIRVFFFEAYKIPSESMVPNLIKEDNLLVNKFSYGVLIPIVNLKLPSLAELQHGDVIVFEYPRYHAKPWYIEMINLISFGIFQLTNTQENDDYKYFIKRLIGKPGDQITFDDPYIHVNGEIFSQQSTPCPKVKASEGYSCYLESIPGRDKSYIVQYKRYDTKISNKNLKSLYVPKKGDVFRIKFTPEAETNITHSGQSPLAPTKEVMFYINDKPIDGPFEKVINSAIPLGGRALWNSIMRDSIFERYYMGLIPKDKLYYYVNGRSFEYVLDVDCYFAMGDNRNDSSDSRDWGFIRNDLMIGTALFIYLPLDRWKIVK